MKRIILITSSMFIFAIIALTFSEVFIKPMIAIANQCGQMSEDLHNTEE